MKVIDIYQRVRKTPDNKGDLDIERPLHDQFGVDLESKPGWWQMEAREQRFIGYWLRRWLSRDTYVGVLVYFLDGKPVMLAQKAGSKSPAELYFIDEQAVNAMRDYVHSFNQRQEKPPVMLADSNQELDEYVVFHSADGVMDTHALYQGELVQVGGIEFGDPEWKSHMNVIKKDGSIRVPIGELEFPLLLAE